MKNSRRRNRKNNIKKLKRSELILLVCKQDKLLNDMRDENLKLNNKLGKEISDIEGYSYSIDNLKKSIKNENEERENKQKLKKNLFEIIRTLIVVSAIAILISTRFLPVVQVSGTSMEPTLSDKDILLVRHTNNFKRGDVVALYYQNKILLKRIIGVPGDYVNINDEGIVSLNDSTIDEPYVLEPSLGNCDINLPYQVQDNRYFVMGDSRDTSFDSRNKEMGAISEEQILGKVIFRIKSFKK